MLTTRPVRLLFILHGGGIGGASLSALYLIRQLDPKVYKPVAVFLADSRMREIFEENGIQTKIAKGLTYFSHTTGEHVHWKNPRGFLQITGFLPSVYRTRQLVKRVNPDIVHLNSSTLMPQLIGAKLAGASTVWQIREHILGGHLGLRRAFHRWAGRLFADRMVFILKSEAKRIGAFGKTHVVYNFVDFQMFDRNKRVQWRRDNPGRKKTVTLLGSVTPIKGVLEFVKAYPIVQKEVGDVRFWIVGPDGKDVLHRAQDGLLKKLKTRLKGNLAYVKQVHEYVAKHCNGGVVFLGVSEDVPGILAQTDVVAFPSTAPHFARPVIEAGAMGIPVVASDIEGPDELVVHGKTGFLCQPGDHQALAEALVQLLRDSELADQMGQKGWERAKAIFEAKKNSDAMVKIYEELTAETKRPQRCEKENGTC